MQKKLFCVYILINKINNKVYVGKTNDIRKRIISHKSKAKTLKTSSAISYALAKYGYLFNTTPVIISKIKHGKLWKLI